MLGRVLVLVRDDQLSLAIGKRGQNVRLASKLVGWDIDVMTREELDQQLDQAVVAYSQIPGVSEELAEGLVSQGFLSFEDLSVIEPDELMEMGSLTQEQADVIVEYAERESERIEKEQDLRRATEKAERQSQEREQRRAEEARASSPPVESKVPPAAESTSEASVEEAAGNKS
jgi:N utilization substance protein A